MQAGSSNPIEAAVRQELGLESTRLSDSVRERVEAAIERRRYRATVGEVAAQAGVKLEEAESALKALAYDSQAVLQVSSDGDVVYTFPPDFRQAIRSKSLVLRAKPLLSKAQSAALFLVRVTFGTALFASIVATFLAITVLLSSRSDSSDNRRGGGGGVQVRMWSLPTDIFYYWSPSYGRRKFYPDTEEEMSLPEAIFSFVFGDGDPNADYDERRWRALGRYIQSRDGVVTAEEMAPFLDPRPPGAGDAPSTTTAVSDDESYVLPCLLKFGGEPFVDDAGRLLYRFPSLQRGVAQREVLGRRPRVASVGGLGWAARQRRAEASASGMREQQQGGDQALPQYEKLWELTAATPGQLAAIVGLGVLNFVGVATLGNMLATPDARYVLLREGLGWVTSAMPFLAAYATAFFGIPAVRYLRNTFLNRGIDARNDAREEAALRLAEPTRALQLKLAAARKAGQAERKLITQGDIVFTTDQDTGQQQDVRELDAWDARFQKEGDKQREEVRR